MSLADILLAVMEPGEGPSNNWTLRLVAYRYATAMLLSMAANKSQDELCLRDCHSNELKVVLHRPRIYTRSCPQHCIVTVAVSAGGVAPAGSVIGIGTQRNIPRLPFFRRLIAETWAGKQMDGDLLRLLNGQPPCAAHPLTLRTTRRSESLQSLPAAEQLTWSFDTVTIG